MWRKEGNVLFNVALQTFYLRLHGVKHMVKEHSAREETRCRHMGYSFRLAARVLLYASSHRQDNTYHGLCYTSRGALARTRNSSMVPPRRIDPTTHRAMSERSYHGGTSRSHSWCKAASSSASLNWWIPLMNLTSMKAPQVFNEIQERDVAQR